jgi:hypothetical protein
MTAMSSQKAADSEEKCELTATADGEFAVLPSITG